MEVIEGTGVVAVIRADSAEQLVDVCAALRDGGVVASEITMTTPKALHAIEQASDKLGDSCVIGVGTVLDAETCRAAILAGAQYVVSPSLDLDVIAMARRYGRPVIPGALTPTEIVTAWSAGADMVKVFPANHFGPRYLKDIHGPLPQIKLTPTGGVDLDTAADWIKAGAAALGVGSALVKKELIRKRDFATLTDLAGQYIRIVAEARGG
jgi:2-dehydro-3-deoxyphosphogluconate aldolase/(4S)-4-hydroxy-2-oxoglutarate aldolase